jgi:crossover junction endodeoxyribonuclease RusA
MSAVVISLVMPPTANNLFAGTGRKRVRTPAYTAWIKQAGWDLIRQRPPRIRGPVSITIEVSETESSTTWDLCNREKATMDLLVAHGLIQGDNKPFVREVVMRWNADITGVLVTLIPLGPQTVADASQASVQRLEASA